MNDWPDPEDAAWNSRMTTTNGAAGKYVFNSTGSVRVTSTDATHATMNVPEELRWAVTKMTEMVGAGWEPCGYTGGSAGERRQFVRVEFRRRPEVSDADD